MGVHVLLLPLTLPRVYPLLGKVAQMNNGHSLCPVDLGEQPQVLLVIP